MKGRFDIEQVIKILGLNIRADQADGGADFDVACNIARKKLLKIKEYEDLEEQGKLLKLACAVGDTVYYRYDGIKIAPMRVEQIIIAQYGINLLLEYCGNDEQLKHWRINIESTAFDNKIIFHTREEAEAALQILKEKGDK